MHTNRRLLFALLVLIVAFSATTYVLKYVVTQSYSSKTEYSNPTKIINSPAPTIDFSAPSAAASPITTPSTSASPRPKSSISVPASPKPIVQKQEESVFYEKILGSRFHGPDGTWWGYNQSKIVRFKDIVFTYVIDNFDESNKTNSNLVVYKKEGDKAWEKGAAFTTSRPGNLLVDSKGILHAFVFEPFDGSKNDSWGRLKHYWFPSSASGDINNFNQETIVDNDGSVETANIRVGAAIGSEDTLAVAFGLTANNPLYRGHSEHLYFKRSTNQGWTHLIAGELLGHDYYYPLTLVSKKGFHLLPIQDDFVGEGKENIYQKIIYFEYTEGNWKKEMVVDLTGHEYAPSRPRLLEQDDLIDDKEGKIHILYKEMLDATDPRKVSGHKHLFRENNQWKPQEIKLGKETFDWLRLVKVEGNLYYLGTTWEREVYLSRVGSGKWVRIEVPREVKGGYPYVAKYQDEGNYVDLLFLTGAKSSFTDGAAVNYYIRIPKQKFLRL